MATRFARVLFFGLLAASSFVQGSAASAQTTLSFSIRVEEKLFINTIAVTACDPVTVLGILGAASPVTYAARVAAYMSVCYLTSLGENPPAPAIVVPLDARIAGGVDIAWRCQAGNVVPIGPTAVTPLPTAGGPEGPRALGIFGVVNPTATRDQIAQNGTMGSVLSGFPHPIVETGFQVQAIRLRRDIFQHLTGAILCATSAQGVPLSSIKLTMAHSAFPSHKLWYRSPINAAAPTLLFNVAQGNFSGLWSLPAVPAP